MNTIDYYDLLRFVLLEYIVHDHIQHNVRCLRSRDTFFKIVVHARLKSNKYLPTKLVLHCCKHCVEKYAIIRSYAWSIASFNDGQLLSH